MYKIHKSMDEILKLWTDENFIVNHALNTYLSLIISNNGYIK